MNIIQVDKSMPTLLTSMLSVLWCIGTLGLGVVVEVVVDGGGGFLHLTPAASARSQSCTPQPSNLQSSRFSRREKLAQS